MDPIHELILAERRDRRVTLAMAGLTALMAIFLSLVPFQDGGRLANAIIGGITGACAIGLFLYGRRSPLSAPALDALVRRPGEVVWLYVLEPIEGGTRSRLMVALQDGRTWPALVPAGRAHAILAALATRFPHATTGYDLDLEERFRRNPASLRRRAP